MAYKINKYSNFNVAEHNHGEWLLGLTDDYIKETVRDEIGVDPTDDQCLEIAEWIEYNIFNDIIEACEELSIYREDDE